MALCNTVHYSYGKYMKDKVRHYKLWQKTCWTIENFHNKSI